MEVLLIFDIYIRIVNRRYFKVPPHGSNLTGHIEYLKTLHPCVLHSLPINLIKFN